MAGHGIKVNEGIGPVVDTKVLPGEGPEGADVHRQRVEAVLTDAQVDALKEVIAEVSNLPDSYALPSEQVDLLRAIVGEVEVTNLPSEYALPQAQVDVLKQVTAQITNLPTTYALPQAQIGVLRDVTATIVNLPSEYPLPQEQVDALSPIGFPEDFPLPQAQVDALKQVEVANFPTSQDVDVEFPEDFPLPQSQVDALTPQSDGLTNAQLRAAPVPVDIGSSLEINELTVVFNSTISEANSTQAPLDADEEFVGEWEEVVDYAAITASIFTDAPSAQFGARAEFSHDGVNVITVGRASIPANFGAYFSIPPQARYFRIRYINGPQAQTVLRSEVTFRFSSPTNTQGPLGSMSTDETIASATKASVVGRVYDGPMEGMHLPLRTSMAGHLSTRVENELALLADQIADLKKVEDDFVGGETLADQSGGGVRTFTFSDPVNLVWVLVQGDDGRADPFGGVPGSGQGIPCPDGVPVPVTVITDEVQAWAPGGATISVWGYRR